MARATGRDRKPALALLKDDGRNDRDARTLLGGWRLFLLSTREIWRYRRATGGSSATTCWSPGPFRLFGCDVTNPACWRGIGVCGLVWLWLLVELDVEQFERVGL